MQRQIIREFLPYLSEDHVDTVISIYNVRMPLLAHEHILLYSLCELYDLRYLNRDDIRRNAYDPNRYARNMAFNKLASVYSGERTRTPPNLPKIYKVLKVFDKLLKIVDDPQLIKEVRNQGEDADPFFIMQGALVNLSRTYRDPISMETFIRKQKKHHKFFLKLYKPAKQSVPNPNPKLNKKKDKEEAKECPICFEEIKGTSMSCTRGHSCHSRCLLEWKKKSNTCPTCRAPL